MAEIRLPIVADLNVDGQDIVGLGAQTLGPAGDGHAARKDYVELSAQPTDSVGGAIVGASTDGTTASFEVAANYLRILNPQYDPASASDASSVESQQYLYVPIAGSLEDLSDTLIENEAVGQFLRFELIEDSMGRMPEDANYEDTMAWINATTSIGDLSDVADDIGETNQILQVIGTGTSRELQYVDLSTAAGRSGTDGISLENLNNIPALPSSTDVGTATGEARVLVWDTDPAGDGTEVARFVWKYSSSVDAPEHTYLNGDGDFTQVDFNGLGSVTQNAQDALPASLTAKGVLTKNADGDVDVINPLITIQEEQNGNRIHNVSHIRFEGQAVEVTNDMGVGVVTITGTGGDGPGRAVDYSFTQTTGAGESIAYNTVSGQSNWAYTVTAPAGYYFVKTGDDTAFGAGDNVADAITVDVPMDQTLSGTTYTWAAAGLGTPVTTSADVGGTGTDITVLTGFNVTLQSPTGFVGTASTNFTVNATLRPIADAIDDDSDEVTSTALTFAPSVYQTFYYARASEDFSAYVQTTAIATQTDGGGDLLFAGTVGLTEALTDGFTFTAAPMTDGTTEYICMWIPNSYSRTPILFAGGFQITPSETENIITGSGEELDNAPENGLAGAAGIKTGYRLYKLPFRFRTSFEIRS